MNLTHLMHLCAATHAIIGISLLTILLRLPHRPEINRTIKYTLLLAHLTLSAYLYHRSPDPAAIAAQAGVQPDILLPSAAFAVNEDGTVTVTE